MKWYLVLAFNAAVTLLPQAHAAGKEITVVNQRNFAPIWEVYITPAGQADWGKDQLGGKVISAGESHSWVVPWSGCYVDILAKTFTGAAVEKRNVNVCGGVKWTIYDESDRPRTSATRTATSTLNGSMTWRITDKCANTESIRFRFFSSDGGWQWPGGSDFWYTKNFGESYDEEIACPAGRKICYGAWQPNNNLTWGAGQDGTDACPSCCYICDGGVHLMTLTCS